MSGCEVCGEKILAKGFCSKHYTRKRRSGSLERTNAQRTGICSVAGCGRFEVARNLCQTHYSKSFHPLRHAWKQLRSRYPGDFDVSWSKFEKFLQDVPEKTHPRSQLRRADVTRPWAKDNVHWTVPLVRVDYMTKEDRAAYGKAWNLRRRYKCSMAKFESMLKMQNALCAICGEEDGIKKDRSGRVMRLHVDHDHKTGKIRELLCARCNMLVGNLGEDAELARKMALYIEWHRGTNFQCDVP